MLNRYPYKKIFTVAAALLTGHASNVTGAVWVIATPSANDDIAHHVTVRNDSGNSHSGKTITLVGTDANNNEITETLTGPGASATVTSTKAFKTLTSATPSATIGADTFDIGWAATGHAPYVDLDPELPASVAVYLVSGSLNFDVQHTYEDPPTEDSVVFNHATVVGKTASFDGTYVAPVRATRVDVNSHTAGVFTFVVLQAA